MDELDPFKQSLQQNIFDAYESGLPLTDGCMAFYDEERKCFVDGASLKPLEGEAAVEAEEAFAALTPQERMANASYLAACALYRIAERAETSGTASTFNAATAGSKPMEAEPVGRIIQRLFRSPFAPKISP